MLENLNDRKRGARRQEGFDHPQNKIGNLNVMFFDSQIRQGGTYFWWWLLLFIIRRLIIFNLIYALLFVDE